MSVHNYCNNYIAIFISALSIVHTRVPTRDVLHNYAYRNALGNKSGYKNNVPMSYTYLYKLSLSVRICSKVQSILI